MIHLIIGNGIAGVCAADAIRELDADTPITLVSDETFPFYSRPMLGNVLDGTQPIEKLPVRSPGFYELLKIEPLLGQRITAVFPKEKWVELADGQSFSYGRLLIASGADPRRLSVPSHNLVLRGDTLVGVTLIGRIEQGGLLQALIELGRPLRMPTEALLSPDNNFARMISI